MIKSNSTDHSTTVTKPAQSPVPLINKCQLQDSNRQLTPRPPSPSALPVTWPVAQSTVPVINKRQPQHSNRQLTHLPPSPSALPVTWPAQSSVPMNKRPSKQYSLRATCPSESSADTNFTSKRSHHSALQSPPSSPPPSPATSRQVVDTSCSSGSNCATLGTVPSNVAPLTLRRSSRLLIKNMKYQ